MSGNEVAGFVDERGTFYPVENGQVTIEESAVAALGIQNLLTIELVSWKNMQEDDASANSEAETQVITVHGFEDSMFGTEDTFQAQTINHLGGFRAGDKASSYEVKRTDLSGVYVSKMYFDAVNRVGYYDEDTASSGQRLTTYTQGTMDSNHARQSHGNVQPEYGEQNCALNLGYKAQGSYLVDFRQVNSLDGPEYSCYMQYGSYRDNEQREISYYNDAIKPVSYNTGLQMTINQELPSDVFDAYYVLVRAQALPFLENMDVTYADGSVMSVSGDEVRAQAKSGAADSVRMDSESNPYFRLNLLRLEDGEHVPDYGKDSGDAYSYRDPFSAYETDAMPKGVQLVESVSYTLSINQCQYTDAINQAGDGRGNTANLPDYGTWFGDSLQYDNPDWINLMSFEVTGRFYKTCDNRQSVTTVTVRAGGDYSG